MADGITHTQSSHAVRLRERARDDDAGIVDGDADVRIVIAVGDVVEVGFVNENRGVGRLAVHLGEKIPRGRGPDIGRGRIVGIAVEDQSRALGGVGNFADVDLELGVEQDGADGMPHHLGVAGAFLVGRDGADERLVPGREEMRARAKDLSRAAPEDNVLGLHALFLGDRIDEVARTAGIATRRPPALAKRVAHRLHDGLAGAERVLVTRQADDARSDGFKRWLDC